MQIKKNKHELPVTQYTITDGDLEFDVIETFGVEDTIFVHFYEEAMLIGVYSLYLDRGRVEQGHTMWLRGGKYEEIDYEDELNVMMGYITEQHRQENEILGY